MAKQLRRKQRHYFTGVFRFMLRHWRFAKIKTRGCFHQYQGTQCLPYMATQTHSRFLQKLVVACHPAYFLDIKK